MCFELMLNGARETSGIDTILGLNFAEQCGQWNPVVPLLGEISCTVFYSIRINDSRGV
jgi:hypothetical protein